MIERKRDDYLNILKMFNFEDLEQMKERINEIGPKLEILFFLDYFTHMHKSPFEYVHHMLSTNGYNVTKVSILDSRIEITDSADSIQTFDL